jgi:hypothetical protein
MLWRLDLATRVPQPLLDGVRDSPGVDEPRFGLDPLPGGTIFGVVLTFFAFVPITAYNL